MPIPSAINSINQKLDDFFRVRGALVDKKNGNWTLRGSHTGSKVTSDSKEKNYVIWPLPVGDDLQERFSNNPIFLAIKVSLNTKDEIHEINIKVFRENVLEPKDSDLTPTELLLRAEWSNDESGKDAKYNHAQAHWHVHSYNSIDKLNNLPIEVQRPILELIDEHNESINASIGNSISSLMDEEDEVELKSQEPVSVNNPSIPLFKFHLAMIADWDLPTVAPNNKKLTNENALLWLPKCLNYIKSQIEYAFEKT